MKIAKIAAIMIVATLLMAIAPAFAAVSRNADSMFIDPDTSAYTTAGTSVGYLFNVTVWLNVSAAQTVFSYQIGLHYNRTQLQCIAAGYTLVTKSSFMSSVTTSGLIQIDTSFLGNGSILASEASLSTAVAGPKVDTLIWAEFMILIAPNKISGPLSSSINISKEYKANGAGNTWVDTTGSGTYLDPLNCYDDSYTYTWAQPTLLPYMGIEHDTGFGVPMSTNPGPATWPVTWGPNPPYVNMTSGFTASLYINDLDANWGLWNASFTLSYNSTVIDVLGGTANITINPLWLGLNTKVYVPGTIDIYVENYTISPGNHTLVATIMFTVMIQGSAPPLPFGYFDSSMLTYSNVAFFDAPSPGGNLPIPHSAKPDSTGQVKVYAVVALPVPYLKVVPASTTFGPAPVIGTVFSVKIQVVNMSMLWYDVAVQFRLQYNSGILGLVSVTEGPWMQSPIWDTYGTFFVSINYLADPIFGDHVAVLDLLLPNLTNGVYDQKIFPNTIQNSTVDSTVAIVTFQVLKQNCFGLPDIHTNLNLIPFWPPSDCLFVDRDANYIPSVDCQNATVTIVSLNFVGRQIDVYGGAVNDGYGVLIGAPYLQFPVPYGGQGPNHWMDGVFPQSFVYLNANVTYNYWPVQAKDVGFEIEGPYDHVTNSSGDFYVKRAAVFDALFGGNPLKFAATTDVNGVATYGFRMPWTCPIPIPPDNLTGIYKVTSTVTIADVVVNDTMLFYYERLVYITSVTTEFYSYIHGQCVKVTVNYRTHFVMTYPALFAVVITDDLNVPFGTALYSTTIGGATFCTWKTGTFQVTICIPKWAYAGNGYVHVSVFDKDPTIGGEALAPEFKPDPQININPY
jgi:hypothetical protein